MKIIILLIYFFALMNCQPKKDNGMSYSNDLQTKSSINMQIDSKELKKITLKQAIIKYGKPVTEEKFILEDVALHEFRIKLYNFFTKKQLNDSIPIKEITWSIKKDSLITVWYKQKQTKWQPIDTFEYSKYDEF